MPVAGGLHAPFEIFARGLAILSGLPGDGQDAESLPLQIVNHDDLPQPDHADAPVSAGISIFGPPVTRSRDFQSTLFGGTDTYFESDVPFGSLRRHGYN